MYNVITEIQIGQLQTDSRSQLSIERRRLPTRFANRIELISFIQLRCHTLSRLVINLL